jgi:RNA polymerase sigma-70 factor (ECF subfamily)
MKAQFTEETLEAFINGNSVGFSNVFDLFYGEICYFCGKVTGNAEEGEDIAIQTFTKLFKMHAQFTNFPNIKAFLYITARNNCLNYLRSLKRKRNHEKQLTQQGQEAIFDNDITETLIVKEIYEAVENLPQECRRVFKLLYFYGMKTAEVAQELSIAQSTVRNHKKNALEQLRVTLANNELALVWLFCLGVNDCIRFLRDII